MAIIANPVYDTVFKFLMEDNRVAKILLSALLQKEVVELHVRQHEYAKKVEREISVLRIDFSAKVRNKDGTDNLVLIELQRRGWRPRRCVSANTSAPIISTKEMLRPGRKTRKGTDCR